MLWDSLLLNILLLDSILIMPELWDTVLVIYARCYWTVALEWFSILIWHLDKKQSKLIILSMGKT